MSRLEDLLLKDILPPSIGDDGQVAAVLTALGASGGFDPAPEGRIALRVVQEAGAISRALGLVG